MILPIWALLSISAWAAAASRQREDLVDDRPGAALIQDRPDLRPELPGDLALLRRGARPHGRARDGEPPDHDRREVDILGPVAAQEGDQHEAAIHGERAQVAGEVGRADHVEDHVHALAAGERLHPLGEILLAVIDRRIRAEAQAGLAFGGRAGGREHPGAARMGELDGGEADPAAAAMDERGLPRREPAVPEEIGPDREIGLGQRGGAERVVAAGPGQALRRRGDRVFRVAAAVHERADPVTRRKLPGIFAPVHDRARHFEADMRARAGRRRILALALGDIGAVHAGRLDPDQHLVGPRPRHGPGRRAQHFGAAGALGLDEGHGLRQVRHGISSSAPRIARPGRRG